MNDWLISTSALILCVLLLRTLFRGKISHRILYALWLVVVIRLLLPFPLAGSAWSAASLFGKIPENRISQTMEEVTEPLQTAQLTLPALQSEPAGGSILEGAEREALYAPRQIPIWGVIWLTGSLLCAIWVLLQNVFFIRGLYRRRLIQPEYNASIPVYAVSGLPSPCMLFSRVYLPLELKNPTAQRHALAHEIAHNNQRDNLWSLVRCLFCILFWWNPLAWAAAFASRADMEMSCDEAAVAQLGTNQRISYGRTLLELVKVRSVSGATSMIPTSMISSGGELKRRIRQLAKGRPLRRGTVILLGVLMLLVCAFTFTGTYAEVHRNFPVEQMAQGVVILPDQYPVPISEGTAFELASCIQNHRWTRISEEANAVAEEETGDTWRVRFWDPVTTRNILLICRADAVYLNLPSGHSMMKYKYYRISRDAFGEELLARIDSQAKRQEPAA